MRTLSLKSLIGGSGKLLLTVLTALSFAGPALAQVMSGDGSDGSLGYCTWNPTCAQSVNTNHWNCPAGQQGQIVVRQTVNQGNICGNDTGWSTVSNSCNGKCTQTTETRTEACTAPQVGQLTFTRVMHQGNVCNVASAWTQTNSTCGLVTTTEPPIVNPGAPLDVIVTSNKSFASGELTFASDSMGPGRNVAQLSNYQSNGLRMCAQAGYTKLHDFAGTWNGKWKGKGDCGNSDIDFVTYVFNGSWASQSQILNPSMYTRRVDRSKDSNCWGRVQTAVCSKLEASIPTPRINVVSTTTTSNPASVPYPSGYERCPADLNLASGTTSDTYFASAMQGASQIGSQSPAAAATQYPGGGWPGTACKYRFKCAQREAYQGGGECISWGYDEWMGGSYCEEYAPPSDDYTVTVRTLDCN